MLEEEGAGGFPSHPSEDSLKVQFLVDREAGVSHHGGRAAPRIPMPFDPSFSGPLGSGACFLSVQEMNGSISSWRPCSVLAGLRGAWPRSPARCLSPSRLVQQSSTQTGWLRNKHVFLTVLGTGKVQDQGRVSVCWAHFLVHRQYLPAVTLWQNWGESSWGPSYTALIPFMRAATS